MARSLAILAALSTLTGCRALVTFDRDRIVHDAGVDAGSMDAATADVGPADAFAADRSMPELDATSGDASAGDASAGECDDLRPCEAGDQCTQTYCDFGTGRCVSVPLDGTSCAVDDDACTADTCVDGVCTAGPLVDCDDDTPCTTDECFSFDDVAYSCDNLPDHAACDDGDDCTDDYCESGVGCHSTVIAALDVRDDGSGAFGAEGLPALVLSEVAPGSHIELFNTTAAPIDLSASTFQLCSPFDYVALSVFAPSVVVPAFGYATVPWPGTFVDDDLRGEVLLYATDAFADATQILDFLCWGTGIRASLTTQAVSVGKWSGGCAGTLSSGAIHRQPSTTGTDAFDYDTISPPSPANACVP